MDTEARGGVTSRATTSTCPKSLGVTLKLPPLPRCGHVLSFIWDVNRIVRARPRARIKGRKRNIAGKCLFQRCYNNYTLTDE